MLKSVAQHLRDLAASMGLPEGDVKQKFYPDPKIKPPRRKPSTVNQSNRSDYSKNYMQDYRSEGKDYQKMTDSMKDLLRRQRKRLKEKSKPVV